MERLILTSEEKKQLQLAYERGTKHMERFKRPPYQHTSEEVNTKGVSKSEIN